MNLFERKHLALSTVVATALMLGAVAVLGSTLVAWSNTNLRAYETSLASSSSDKTNKFNEFLTIENVWFCRLNCPHSSLPGMNITMTNVGNIGLNVTQIKLINSSKINVYSISNGAIIPGTSYMWYNNNYDWKSQVPISIYVTTNRGTIFATQVTPP